jgi:hypothetical protein
LQFSIAKLFLLILFFGLLLGATFTFPNLAGLFTLFILAGFILPAFVIVGVVNTRGLRQSFFLGAMVTGIPHFVYVGYMILWLPQSFDGANDFTSMLEFVENSKFGRIGQFIWILMGCLGGLSGMAAYGLITMGTKPKKPVEEPDSKSSTTTPDSGNDARH